MKKNIIRIIGAALSVAALFSCSEAGYVDTIPAQKSGLTITVADPVRGDIESKSIDEDFVFSFEDGDFISVFGASAGECMTYSISKNATSGASATFNIEKFHMDDGTYYATYPALDPKSDPEAIALTFAGQEQTSNNSAAHLAAYDYNSASAQVTDDEGSFSFLHKVSWLKVTVPVTNATKFSSLTLSADEGVALSAELDALTGEVTTTRSAGDKIVLSFGEEGISVAAGGSLVAFVTVPSETYTGLTVKATANKGSFEYCIDSEVTLAEGLYYTLTIEEQHTSIAALCEMAGTSSRSFDVNVKNAVVTCVSGKYAHIQDESGAILVFANSHGLSVGDCISGQITGSLVLYNGYTSVSSGQQAYAEITSINTSKATITNTTDLPVTEATLSDVVNNIEDYYNERVLIKGVEVTAGISSPSQKGSVSQGTASAVIFNKNASVINAGVTGDLICYPSVYKGEIQLIIYSADQFTEVSPDSEDTPFTQLSAPGWYSSTNTDSPSAVLQYNDGYDQMSVGSGSSSRTFKVFNIENGTFGILNIQTSALTVGSVYSGTEDLGSGAQDRSFTVVSKSGKKVWLEDKTAHTGCIIEIE